MARPLSEESVYARSLGLLSRQLKRMGGMERVKAMPEPQRNIFISMSKRESLNRLLMKYEKLKANCPDGYSVMVPGMTVNMLGAAELWRIFEKHAEPYRIRIPEDLIDNELETCPARVPKEWGRPLYYKLVSETPIEQKDNEHDQQNPTQSQSSRPVGSIVVEKTTESEQEN